jgi:phenylpropionate dioxygenase-like ring-hydroxylating dioxygenase large terminal subunit
MSRLAQATLRREERANMAKSIHELHAMDIREDFVPKESFISPEFLRLENERMWPKVWQIACREEEIPNVGDYVTYEIAGESIVVTRTAPGEIKSYYNVCQHRGRILREEPHGSSKLFYCKYHGWRWGLDGTLQRVMDEHDWAGCPSFNKGDLRLKETLVDSWGGFVFINMDLNAEPLAKYLDPVPQYLDCFEFEKWRYRWYKTVILPCNWKTALEGFNEAYHVAATHPQILDDGGDDFTRAYSFGRHGMYKYPIDRRPAGAPAARTGRPVPDDLRPGLVRFFEQMDETLAAMFTPRAVHATKRLLTEVSAAAPVGELYGELQRFHREAAEEDGAGWPPLMPEQQMAGGTNWHVFPNHVFLQLADGSIAYRARPNGNDPDSCIFDIWSLVRYAPGQQPNLEREFYPDWRADTVKNFGLVLAQDFSNFYYVQKGMHSRGFAGARTNPVQEGEIPNMHRALYNYVFGPDGD